MRLLHNNATPEEFLSIWTDPDLKIYSSMGARDSKRREITSLKSFVEKLRNIEPSSEGYIDNFFRFNFRVERTTALLLIIDTLIALGKYKKNKWVWKWVELLQNIYFEDKKLKKLKDGEMNVILNDNVITIPGRASRRRNNILRPVPPTASSFTDAGLQRLQEELRRVGVNTRPLTESDFLSF